MYNGIGLATVRGSGTNGYVQKNAAFVSQSRAAERKGRSEGVRREIPQPKQPDAEIIEHKRKRDVEVKVLKLREALEEQGVEEATIEEKTDALRKSLLEKLPAPASKRRKGANEAADARGDRETHSMAAAKEQETAALKSALGISSEYQAGQAFDRELQARKREERMAQRAAEEAKVAELEALLEKERKREEKEKLKDEKKRAKKEKKAEKKAKKREKEGKPPKEAKAPKEPKEPKGGSPSLAPPPPLAPPPEERGRGRDEPRAGRDERRDERRGSRSRSRSDSRSPSPRRRSRSPSRSRSPRRRSRSGSRSRSYSRSGSRSKSRSRSKSKSR